jgi:hypothetical protein
MAKVIELIYPLANDSIVAAEQDGLAGEPLTLNVDFPGATQVTIPGMQRVLSITTTDDMSGVNFTFVGEDNYGFPVTETIAGPAAGLTVETTNQYHVLYSVTPDDDYETISIGTGNGATFNWVMMNANNVAPAFSIQGVRAGTISYSVNQTLDPVQKKPATATSYTGFALSDPITDATANIFVSFNNPLKALQLIVGALGTDETGYLNLKILQQGID